VTILLATHRLPPILMLQAREACETLELTATEWARGVPPIAPRVVIAALDPGARRIPDDVMTLLEAAPALRLVLCAQEPLVKPRVVLGDGRVCVLSPPIERAHLVSVLREAVVPPGPASPASGSRCCGGFSGSRGRAGARARRSRWTSGAARPSWSGARRAIHRWSRG